MAPRVAGQGHYERPAGPQPQQQGGNGGPTSFTNQPLQGAPPGGQNFGQRGDRGSAAAAAPAAQPQPAPQNDQNRSSDRGNWQGRDNRGDQNRYDRGNWQGRRDGGNNFDNNRGANYGNRGGYNGQRRDFSNFRDYHRDFRAARRFRGPGYHRPAGWYNHRWTFGEFLPAAFWARDYWLIDFRAYDLPPPPYGTVWVRVGTDALLVDRYNGEIITVEYDVFY